MNVMSRIVPRLMGRVARPPTDLDIVIAERFVAEVRGLCQLRLPGVIDAAHPDRPLAVMIMDEAGAPLRQAELLRVGTDGMLNQITLDPLWLPAGTPLWLFVFHTAPTAELTPQGVIDRLWGRAQALGNRKPIELVCIGEPEPVAQVGLHIVVAERFIPSAPDARRLRVPGELDAEHPARQLHAMIMDEAGAHLRHGMVVRATANNTWNEIAIEPLSAPPGKPLWLFVYDADTADGQTQHELAASLLRHAHSLGDRPLIEIGSIGAASSSKRIGFAGLSEYPDPRLLPRLDQPEVDEAALMPEQRAWRRDGVVVLRDFMPASLLDPYIERRAQLARRGGWMSASPYMHVPELRAVCLYPPLREMMRRLIGEEMMLHLNLTGWISTERNWHQDDYLNPSFVNSWYAAVWFALDDIHPDSGPFEYVPGSHRWPLLRGDKVRAEMTPRERAAANGPLGADSWPKITERFVVPAIEAEIRDRQAPAQQFLGTKGDVLIWHGRLLHRGTKPVRTDLERRALIAHYSGVSHRPDMANRRTDRQGGVYAAFDTPLF
jgi:hypothetical protein